MPATSRRHLPAPNQAHTIGAGASVILRIQFAYDDAKGCLLEKGFVPHHVRVRGETQAVSRG